MLHFPLVCPLPTCCHSSCFVNLLIVPTRARTVIFKAPMNKQTTTAVMCLTQIKEEWY